MVLMIAATPGQPGNRSPMRAVAAAVAVEVVTASFTAVFSSGRRSPQPTVTRSVHHISSTVRPVGIGRVVERVGTGARGEDSGIRGIAHGGVRSLKVIWGRRGRERKRRRRQGGEGERRRLTEPRRTEGARDGRDGAVQCERDE